MKIVQMAPRFPPSVGGTEVCAYNLVKGLRKLGHDVTVITSDIPPVGSYIMNNVAVYRLPVLFRLYKAPFCPSLFFMLNKIKADIVHVHMPPRGFADYASVLHNLGTFSPLILSFHLYLENAPSFIRALSIFHYKTVGRFIFRSSDRIIVPSETYKVLLVERFNIYPEKIKVIPHGVDLEVYDPEKFKKEEIKRKYRISSRKVILFVGRLDAQGAEQKGIKYLLKAIPLVIKEVSSVKFLIAGGGERIDHLKELSRKLGIIRYVRFIGNFSNDEAPSLFSMADVFVLPSLSESFGIVLCEAMAMEKPVIATRIRGVVDVVENRKTGFLVEPKNPKALAQAILSILSDEALARQLGREGRKRVEKKYNWNLAVKRTLKVYKECNFDKTC